MSSYCECGHVWGVHYEEDGACTECECEVFEELSEADYRQLDLGYD